MPAFGPKQTSRVAPHMSAFGSKADTSCTNVRFAHLSEFVWVQSLRFPVRCRTRSCATRVLPPRNSNVAPSHITQKNSFEVRRPRNSYGLSAITPSSLTGHEMFRRLAESVTIPSLVSAIRTMAWKIGSSITTARHDGSVTAMSARLPMSALGQKRTSRDVRMSPLYPQKQTCAVQLGMSAKCHKQTWKPQTQRKRRTALHHRLPISKPVKVALVA
jgi:hypothetical protein